MNADEFDGVLSEMGADVSLQESQAEAEARRRRVVSQMQRVNVELVREAQKVRWLRWGVGGGLFVGAAAAVALFAFAPLTSEQPLNTEVASIPSSPFSPLRTEMTKGSVTRVAKKNRQQLGLGDSLLLKEEHVLETEGDSHARVHGGRGLDIDVGPGSRVVVGAVDSRTGAAKIQLERGFVNCSVDPNGEGPKLSVITPDATVVVKGTIFSVEVSEDGDSTRSCVRVSRGLVSVTRGGVSERVGAGESSGCEEPEASVEAEPAERLDVSAAMPSKPTAKKASTRAAADEPRLPSLAVQNSLLAQALSAERNGRLDEAERQLSQLLVRFPKTPLRVDAETARARIRKRRLELKQ